MPGTPKVVYQASVTRTPSGYWVESVLHSPVGSEPSGLKVGPFKSVVVALETLAKDAQGTAALGGVQS